MASLAALAGTVALLLLAACGGGGGGGGSATAPADVTLPPAQSADSRQAPVIQFGRELRIGTVLPPARSALATVASHGDATASYGPIGDGIGASTLLEYLSHDATQPENPPGNVRRFGSPPTVRYVEGTTVEQIDEIVRAVQLLNANLPSDFQLALASTPVDAATDADAVDANTLPSHRILVEYDRREDWETSYEGEPDGVALVADVGGTIVAARVWVDHTRSNNTMETLVHELIHTLGRLHPDPARFPDTIMKPTGGGVAGYVLHPLDQEALLAVYGTLQAGDTPANIATDLGPWDDESTHLRGDLASLAFGAALRNGLVRPWAAGPRPGADLADNAELTGSASWVGRLLGLTPTGEAVAGGAEMTVDLAGLGGDLDFTELESWAGAPGLAGTGAMWRDGDLNYRVSVRGNLFRRVGGDNGHITGAFFGASHEGMGGTLVRDDLSAGFAGQR